EIPAFSALPSHYRAKTVRAPRPGPGVSPEPAGLLRCPVHGREEGPSRADWGRAMITDEIRENLAPLQADYTKAYGSPFAHFYCPLLCQDEDVELCMGHVISKSWKNCCRAMVVQRGDIDHWYGSIAEAEFGKFLEAREAGLDGVVTDEKLLKQVKPKILVDGK